MKAVVGVALILGCLGGLAGSALAAAPEVAPVAAFRHVTGKVVDAAGAPVVGAAVSLYQEAVLSGPAGEFQFPNVSMRHLAEVSLRVRSVLTGYIIGCISIDVPVGYYPVAASVGDLVAIEIVDMADPKPLELKLRVVGTAAIDEYCNACHGTNPCTEETTYEKAIKTGLDLRGIIVDDVKVEEHKKQLMAMGLAADTYQKIRYQDTHPDGMNMAVIPTLEIPLYRGRFRWPEGLKLKDEKFVTCDTCHTRHVPTGHRAYTVMPFEQGNELCYQCHL